MKKLLLACLSFGLCAQESGAIYFKETIKFDVKIDENNSEIAKMMPTSRDAYKVLYFNQTESLQKNEEHKNSDLEIKKEEGDSKFNIVIKTPKNIVYQNISTNKYLNELEFMGKDFLIDDKLDANKWKVTSEQKMILDYVCLKATLIDSTKKLSAWFTPQISLGFGPNGYAGLPGMILGTEEDGGKRLLVATEIKALPMDFVFEKPSKGKKTGRAEFAKIREEKMKEMGASGSGGGVRMIITSEKH